MNLLSLNSSAVRKVIEGVDVLSGNKQSGNTESEKVRRVVTVQQRENSLPKWKICEEHIARLRTPWQSVNACRNTLAEWEHYERL